MRLRNEKAYATESTLETIVRSFVLALAFIAAFFPLMQLLTVLLSSFLVLVFSAMGAFFGRTRFRTSVLVAVFFVFVFFAIVLWPTLVSLLVSPLSLGASRVVSDVLLLGLGSAFVLGGWRALSGRYAVLRFLEVVLILGAFSLLVMAHRNGSINRPFSISDPLIAAGKDPTVVFVAIGIIAFVLVALYILAERSVVRAIGVSVVAMLALLVIAAAGLIEPPSRASSDSIYAKGGAGEEGSSSKEGAKDKSKSGGKRKIKGDVDKQESGQSAQGNDPLRSDSGEGEEENQPVAIVALKTDVTIAAGSYYLRQGVFSEYNGSRFVASQSQGIDADIIEQFGQYEQRVSLPDSPRREKLNALYAVLGDTSQPPTIANAELVRMAQNPNPSLFRTVYRAESQVRVAEAHEYANADVGKPDWDEEVRRTYLEAPRDERYRKLLSEIYKDFEVEGEDLAPMLKVALITKWLGKHGSYTLENRHAGADDPLASFLFGDITGYCVHFSHAAVALLRTAGIPARVGTGFSVPVERRGRGSGLIVMAGDAHAWPEVYVRGEGWVIADVYPETILDDPNPSADPDLQNMLAELLRAKDARPPEFSASSETLGFFQRAFTFLQENLWQILTGLLAIVFALGFLGKAWFRWLPFVFRGQRRVLAEYRSTLTLLSELGHRRKQGESREDFAKRILPSSTDFSMLTQDVLAIRFGKEKYEPDAKSAIRAAKASRDRAREQAEIWRRMLTIVDPFSWILARR